MAEHDTLREQCRQCLHTMISLLGFQADISATEAEDTITLNLKTNEAGRLIGRRGHCLQSLELLLQTILRRQQPDCPAVEIVIDGYRNSRGPQEHGGRRSTRTPVDEERLRTMALDAAKEVVRWGEPQRIGPLDAAERRVVHMVLREEPGVTTESEEPDANGRKRVLVRLANAPDA
ncbi:MAG: KH domain-containing protein [Lentisphaeria bacterium]|nr:KH domain-containing protein [Lentisphaeria bacterium]